MAWRPAPRSNPLLALRRVVEQPDGDPNGAGAGRRDQSGTVRIASAAAVAVKDPPTPPFDGVDAAIAAGGSPSVGDRLGGPARPGRRDGAGGRGRPWPGVASGRRRPESPVSRPPASQPEPSHRDPARNPQTLITTTPAGGMDPASVPPLPPLTPRAAVIVSPTPPMPTVERAPTLKAAEAVRAAAPGPVRPAPPLLRPAEAAQGLARVVPPPRPAERPAEAPSGPPTDALAAATAERRRTAGDPRRAPGLPPRRVLAVMLTCLGLWTFVDAPALQRSAAAAHLGTRRRVALDLLGPVSRLSAVLGVDRISRAGDELRGRRRHPSARPAALAGPNRAAPYLIGPTVPAAPTSTAPPAPVAPLRVPSAADPLRVLIVGDSLGLSFGQSVAAKLDASGVTTSTVDAREGTGLARPDSFDWVAQLQADIVRFHPEVVVASFGGNDDQDVQVSGRYVGFGTPQWRSVYGDRVARVVGEVAAAHARLVWSGLPVMRSSAKTARLETVMAVTRAAVTGSPSALWLPNLATLADPSGHYQVALPDSSGKQVLVREPDGVHETRAGADRLADRAITAMVSAWHLQLKPAAS